MLLALGGWPSRGRAERRTRPRLCPRDPLWRRARVQDRIGSTGNQFAISTLLGALCLLPVWIVTEASKFGAFMEIFKESAVLRNNLITSGLYFYLYNELSTLTIAKTSATTQSVANTAKRVIVIVGVAIALGTPPPHLGPVRRGGHAHT